MINASFFSFLYSIFATMGCHIIFGANIRALHAMFLVLLMTGLNYFVLFGYSSVAYVIIGMIVNLLTGGAFMLGGIYKGIYLDVPDKKARQIFVGLIATFFFLLLSLLMAEPEAFLGIPNFLSYLFILIIIFIFSVIFILRKRM